MPEIVDDEIYIQNILVNNIVWECKHFMLKLLCRGIVREAFYDFITSGVGGWR